MNDAALIAVLIVLVLAVAFLFLMLGEIYGALVSSGIPIRRSGAFQAVPNAQAMLDGANIGGSVEIFPSRWPDSAVEALGILSTTCQTCHVIAQDLNLAGPALRPIVFVVSGPSSDAIESFIDTYSLSGLPIVKDVSGEWTTDNIGLSMSPVLVELEDVESTADSIRGRIADVSLIESATVLKVTQPALRTDSQ